MKNLETQMAQLLNNIRIINPYSEPSYIENGFILVEDAIIKTVGEILPTDVQIDEQEDLRGKMVLPGMINMHTHLYSTLAMGMPPPQKVPSNFVEILENVWWPLDRALDHDAIKASFKAGLLEHLRWGCTTVFDHHSSPNCTEGVLDLLAIEAESLGVHIALAFETSDRDGEDIFRQQLQANLDAISNYSGTPDVLPLLGLHASFTLSDESLKVVGQKLKDLPDVGVHIHVSEDKQDEMDAQERGFASVIDRLNQFGLLNPKTVLAHGLHIKEADVEILQGQQVTLVHNPSSNANNRVGLLPGATIRRLQAGLGTDGMQYNMLDEVRQGSLIRTESSEAPVDYLELLFGFNPCIASKLFGQEFGHIKEGCAADLVFFDYDSRTDLNADNWQTHILWGLTEPSDVMTKGIFRKRNGNWLKLNSQELHEEARLQSKRLWEKMNTHQ